MDRLEGYKIKENPQNGTIEGLYLDVRNGILRELIVAKSASELAYYRTVDQNLSRGLLKPTADRLEEIQDIGPLEWGISCMKELLAAGFKPTFTIPRKFKDTLTREGLIPRPAAYGTRENVLVGTIGIEYFQEIDEDWRLLAILIHPQKYALTPRLTGNPPIFRGVIKCNSAIALEDLIIIDSKDMSILSPSNIPNVEVMRSDEKVARDGTRKLISSII